MVVACDKYLHQFECGAAEMFHAIEQDGKKFKLYEEVEIIFKWGYSVRGTIGYIAADHLDINLGRKMKRISFENIYCISY